jgi:hypothetical protein
MTVNDNGIQQIANFLAVYHKKGSFTRNMLHAWASEAEFSMSEGNDATIEIKSWDSVHGRTQTFTISSEGLSANKKM